MEDRREGVREAMVERGSSMRQKALSIAAKRKQEYLGARVPKVLREKILMRADMLGIPVSILIRNILTDYIENLADEVPFEELASARLRESDDKNKKVFDEVIGWEKLTLNKEVVCKCCTKQLNKGDEVVFGIVPGKSHVILCKQCKSLEGIG